MKTFSIIVLFITVYYSVTLYFYFFIIIIIVFIISACKQSNLSRESQFWLFKKWTETKKCRKTDPNSSIVFFLHHWPCRAPLIFKYFPSISTPPSTTTHHAWLRKRWSVKRCNTQIILNNTEPVKGLGWFLSPINSFL